MFESDKLFTSSLYKLPVLNDSIVGASCIFSPSVKTFQILCLTARLFCHRFRAFACRWWLYSLAHLFAVLQRFPQRDPPRSNEVVMNRLQHGQRYFLELDLRLLLLHHWCQVRRYPAHKRPVIKNENIEEKQNVVDTTE